MTPLLRYFSWSYARRHPLRILLSTIAVTLGVALFVSVDVSNTSTEAAFRRTVERLAGNAQLQVVRGRTLGIEEEALRKIDALPGLKAAPILQVSTTLPGMGAEGTFLILGLDFKRESSFRLWDVAEGEAPKLDLLTFLTREAIVVTRSFAARHGLKPGRSFAIDTALGSRTVGVGAIVRDEGPAEIFGGNIAVMELRTAQRLFKRQGRVDRIEILVTGSVEDAARRLREALGPDYKVQPPPKTNSFLEEALTRIKALLGISVIALLVAIFIIYNSVSISVVERVREIGTLRALGATRGQILAVILLEWAGVGLVGSAAGLALGSGLAGALIQMTAREVNQVVMIVDVGRLTILPRTILAALVLGGLTTLLAAAVPARQAMSIAPIEMLRKGLYSFRSAPGYLRAFGIGLGALGLTAMAIATRIRFENVGLVACFVAFLGAALVLPQLTLWTARGLQPVLRHFFRLEGFLAGDAISKFPQRTALTVIALAGALAMMVISTSIILSFKVRGTRWMEEAFPFDCSVMAIDFSSGLYSDATLPEGVAAEVASLEGIESTYGVRQVLQDYGEHDVMMFALEIEKYARMQGLRGKTGLVPAGARPDLLGGRGVVISDNFAAIHGAKKGDPIVLATRRGPRRFTVLATYEDYSWPQGTIFIDRGVYQELWGDASITYLNVKLRPGVPAAEAKHRIGERVKGDYSLFVYDVADLKRVGDETMDRTLRFTNVQVTVAVLIGFLGIVNTLLISVMRREREIGLLRAVGMTRGQVAGMVVIESVFVAFVGGVLGVGLGLAGARWPVSLHVFHISGYWMPLEIPWGTLLLAMGTALAIGFLASYLPARRAARLSVLEAIGYE